MSSDPKTDDIQSRAILQKIARKALIMRGLLPEFSSQALAELAQIKEPAKAGQPGQEAQVRDLKGLLWASIDNDDSEDLDQLTFAKELSLEKTRILVAIADVDALVKKNSAIDQDGRTTPL